MDFAKFLQKLQAQKPVILSGECASLLTSRHGAKQPV